MKDLNLISSSDSNPRLEVGRGVSGVVVAREDEPEESLGLEGRFDAVFVSEVTGYGEVCEEKCEVIDKVLIL